MVLQREPPTGPELEDSYASMTKDELISALRDRDEVITRFQVRVTGLEEKQKELVQRADLVNRRRRWMGATEGEAQSVTGEAEASWGPWGGLRGV